MKRHAVCSEKNKKNVTHSAYACIRLQQIKCYLTVCVSQNWQTMNVRYFNVSGKMRRHFHVNRLYEMSVTVNGKNKKKVSVECRLLVIKNVALAFFNIFALF